MYIPKEVLNPCEERQGLCKQMRILQDRSSFSVHISIPRSCNRTYTTETFLFSVRFRLHVPSTSQICVPFKNWVKTVLWCYLHTTSKRLKLTRSGDVDDMCKRVFTLRGSHLFFYDWKIYGDVPLRFPIFTIILGRHHNPRSYVMFSFAFASNVKNLDL